MGNWVFGCDVCQDVCPWQRFAPVSREPAFATTPERAAPPLRTLLALTEAQFAEKFAGSPVLRAGRDQLVRNACVAAGNSADESLLTPLWHCLADPSAEVRAHAAWALQRLGTPLTALADALRHDTHAWVMEELASLSASE
jgi:epoxyqueuosine reductase